MELSWACGCGSSGPISSPKLTRFYGLDCGGYAGEGASGYVDCATGSVEHLDKLETDTGVSAGDDEDFFGQRGDVIFDEVRRRGKKLGENASPGHD